MHRTGRRILLPVILTLCCADGPALTAPAPMVVMTDTASYCNQLSAELSRNFATIPPTPDEKALAENGQRLCLAGAVRAGITRLRRAMLFLRNEGHLQP